MLKPNSRLKALLINDKQIDTIEQAMKGYPDIYDKLLEALRIDCLEDMLAYHFEEALGLIERFKAKRI